MFVKPDRGLFVTGTGTEVGKTYVTCLIAKRLRQQGYRVGAYKPAASGAREEDDRFVWDDPLGLWHAIDRSAPLERVCPQTFRAPLAPHLAARAEGRELDYQLLRQGISYWSERCDIVLVEGAGGLMSPISDDEYAADLACDLGYPLVVVAANELGTINHTLQTLITAATFRDGLPVAGVVLNQHRVASHDPSTISNAEQLQKHAVPPLLADVAWQADQIGDLDWFGLSTSMNDD